MNVLLVAGGSPAEWPTIDAAAIDYFVGVDRGSLFILEKDWRLDLAVGDFDSLTNQEKEQVTAAATEVEQAQAEKDDTDTQLALVRVFAKFPKAQITIVGATGGRLDHFLSNLWLPLENRFEPFIRQIEIRDRLNSFSYYLPGSYTLTKEPQMKYLAYCCLTPVTNLSLTESKYTLTSTDFDRPLSLASNEFVGTHASFSFDTGCILVIQSRDLIETDK